MLYPNDCQFSGSRPCARGPTNELCTRVIAKFSDSKPYARGSTTDVVPKRLPNFWQKSVASDPTVFKEPVQLPSFLVASLLQKSVAAQPHSLFQARGPKNLEVRV